MSGPPILVVDDIEMNRDVLVQRLRALGYENVATAEDGRQALALIEARPFDLVLLDVMMPVMNGYEVLERLRDAGRLAELPVVVVSALTEVDSIVRCLQTGAEDYLTKPINTPTRPTSSGVTGSRRCRCRAAACPSASTRTRCTGRCRSRWPRATRSSPTRTASTRPRRPRAKFGEPRLEALLDRVRGEDGEAIATAVAGAVAAFRGAAEPTDDLTLLVLRWTDR